MSLFCEMDSLYMATPFISDIYLDKPSGSINYFIEKTHDRVTRKE